MKGKERIEKFLELQNKNLKFEDISKCMDIKPQTLKAFLNRKGYKLHDGKYILKDSKLIIKSTKNKKENNKTIKSKMEKKINFTVEDLDKLCEVYDWYLQVKDLKSIKTKKTKKDIKIEKDNIKELKTTTIRVDKNTWQEFERLCANSNFSKQQIITQAINNFMIENKHLL